MIQDPVISRFVQGAGRVCSNVKSVYLFGSRARGTERPDSDYDILLVTDSTFTLKDKDRLYDVVLEILLDTGRLVSLKIFREDKFRELASIPTPFMEHVLTEGIKLG